MAAITAVATIIVAICEAVAKKNESKYGAIDKAAVESSIPDASDFDGLGFGDETGTHTPKSKTWLWIAAVAAGALLLFKKK